MHARYRQVRRVCVPLRCAFLTIFDLLKLTGMQLILRFLIKIKKRMNFATFSCSL